MSVHRTIVAGVLLLGLFGCQVDYPNYRYTPRPAEAALRRGDQADGPAVKVLASVIGLERDTADDAPFMTVRMRLDNQTDQQVQFNPADMELLTGQLRNLGRPRVDPSGPVQLEPGQQASLTARFALPPLDPGKGRDADNIDLRSLRLQWSVRIGGQPVQGAVNFSHDVEYERFYHHRHYDDWYPGWHYHRYYGGWHTRHSPHPRFGYWYHCW